jgi:hypothetical protein
LGVIGIHRREDWRQVASQPDLQNAKRKAQSAIPPCRSSTFSPKHRTSTWVWLYIFLCPLIFLNHKSSRRSAYKCFIELHSALSRSPLLYRVNRFDARHDRFDLIIARIDEYGAQQFFHFGCRIYKIAPAFQLHIFNINCFIKGE